MRLSEEKKLKAPFTQPYTDEIRLTKVKLRVCTNDLSWFLPLPSLAELIEKHHQVNLEYYKNYFGHSVPLMHSYVVEFGSGTM